MPSGCKEFIDDLIDYADGELQGARAASLTGHLRACEGCREALAEIRSMLGVLSESPPPPPDSYFDNLGARIMERIRSGEADPWWERTRRFFGASLWRPAAAFAPVAAAIAVALFVVLRDAAPDLPATSDEIRAIVKQVRFYSPLRQLHLAPITMTEDDQGEGAAPVALARGLADDDTDLTAGIREERVFSAVPVGFTAPDSDLSEKDVIELKDCLDEAFESWSI